VVFIEILLAAKMAARAADARYLVAGASGSGSLGHARALMNDPARDSGAMSAVRSRPRR
jgi:hypothetical protein